MSNRFEEYIKRNRQAFDEDQPSSRVWENVSRHLPVRKRDFQWVWKAAAVVFFATSVFLLAERTERGAPRQTAMTGTEFNQVEDFYFREISQKRALIQDMSEIGISAEAELQKLDAMYLVLKDQLKQHPSQEVIEALTLNLIVRLDLLNQVVAEIETKNVNDEKVKPKAQAEI